MYTGIAILIIVILFIIVVTWYQHWVISYYLCTVNPDIWCYNDWSCEATPGQIGGLTCDGDNCQDAITRFYNGEFNNCGDSCTANGGCGCAWGDTFTAPVEDNGAACSMAGIGGGPGMFACGENDQRCPSEGSGCIPNCLEPGPGCC